jgi:predicted transcriptional regulator
LRKKKDVTEAELAVLEALWEGGPAAIREIAERLYRKSGPVEYATVQKLLERLRGKGFVERLRGKGFVERLRGEGLQVFTASVGREDLIGRRLRDVADALCSGSLTPLLTELVRSSKLDAAEIASLRALLDDLHAEGGSKKRRSD